LIEITMSFYITEIIGLIIGLMAIVGILYFLRADQQERLFRKQKELEEIRSRRRMREEYES